MFKKHFINYTEHDNFFNCTRASFMDKKVCKHIVMICMIEIRSLPGLIFEKKFSLRSAQRRQGIHKSSKALDM